MKIILLTQRVDINQAYGERRDALDQRYADYVASMGFAPYPVPNLPKLIPCIIEDLDITGLVLTGGNDLSDYGGDAPERDETERKLIVYCQQKNIPILGICRGMQVLAHYCVGTTLSKSPEHICVRHDVEGLINKNVNSYHGWKVDPFQSNDYQILAHATDGQAEAMRHATKPIMGIMWHPEREDKLDIFEQQRFKYFFETGKIVI